MTHIICMLTAKNRDQLRNPTLDNRVWATFTFLLSQELLKVTIVSTDSVNQSTTSSTMLCLHSTHV